MFTSKQRSELRSLAQNVQPIAQLGKGGISDNVIYSLSDALEARELVKVTVLNNSESEADELARELESKLKAEIVCVIGHKIILYRRSSRKNFDHIKF